MSDSSSDSRYELIEPVGRGGMATVWRARDRVGDLEVALKVLHEHLAEDDGIVEAFEREARLMEAIDHPGVVRIFETTEIEGRPAIAMELCEADDLADRLRSRGSLGEREALRILVPVLQALQAVHGEGVLHRDVKPDNILFVDGQPKLIDFGIGQAEELMAADEDGQVGTVEYMAPERVDGLAVDARADIYSAGVMLFEMLVGHPPYRADSASEVLRMHRSGEVADPRVFDGSISDRSAEAAMRAMAKHPGDRFDSVTRMREALEGDGAGRQRHESSEHRLWRALAERYGSQEGVVADLERQGREWVVYVPPVAQMVLYGFERDQYLDVLVEVVDDYADYARVDLPEGDDERRSAVQRGGVARGLSRRGAEQLVDRLESRGIPVRMARRPRSRRIEPLEVAMGWGRRAAIGGFVLFGLAALVGVVGAFVDAEAGRTPVLAQQWQLAAVGAGMITGGIIAGILGLPTSIREWWLERFCRDYTLDFCSHRRLAGDEAPIGRREYELCAEIQSPRIRASYERAVNAALQAGERDEIGEDQRDRLLGDIVEIAEQIVEVETEIAAIRPARVSGRIRRLDRRIGAEDEIEVVEELMEEKAQLRERLVERDGAQQTLQSLAQRIHELARRLEGLVDEESDSGDGVGGSGEGGEAEKVVLETEVEGLEQLERLEEVVEQLEVR